MFKRIAPVIALSMLSGCTMMNGDEHHQATLAAIQHSESHIDNHLTNLELQISNQMDYIDSLEREITSLKKQVRKLEHTASEIDDQTGLAAKQDDQVPTLAVPESTVAARHQQVLGSLEKVTIDSLDKTFTARVDTGAASSSLNAVDVQEFERNSKKWVRFHLVAGDDVAKDAKWIEAPIVRYVRILQANSEKAQRRAVVQLWVKLGDIHEKTPFTLADRSQMSHPVLLGRDFIRDIAVVDVSKQYVQTSKNTK
ncbi:ATP-dependent Zn protease [Vibrio sp. CAIM 722]|uniref:ATP-dependent Zn protease n=1 Tax=Vibrio eleionomae TaxID=2653505 RepID=A0A7X4RWC8_9VIBR|nr:ATP-dependent zinc protease [Vibrio eleionomae]MZI95197.1 ATP-dependent Zn protease [Vibrio eleionomae]